jgi:glycosyltransferase involved in cell wall biosynthesis
MTRLRPVPLADTSARVTEPRVSVAISTRNRPGLLRRLVRHLDRQTLGAAEFEVVIVDDASTDDTPRVLQELVEQSALAIRALRRPTRSGPSGGRNVAWASARAPVVAFTDDDCTPAPEWLEQGLKALERDDVLVGRTIPDPALPRGPFSRTVHHESANWIATCNVFYWRDDIQAVGGFDERFGSPACEDTDLGLRVVEHLGRRLRYAHNVLVYHDVRRSNFVEALRETQKWSSVGRLFRSHPRARAWLHRGVFWHPSHPRALLAGLGLLLAPALPPALLLTLPWLGFRLRAGRLPGRRRVMLAVLPGIFVVDLAETIAIVRGAIRHRTLVI